MKRILELAAVALLLAGCRTTKQVLDDYEMNFTTGNYQAMPGEVAELAAKGDDSRLLWHLLAGAGYHVVDDKANAYAQFDAAESVFAQNDAASVFSQAGEGALAMMTNDRSFPYDGGGQDRIFTCLYKAIDFMCEGKSNLARVEINRFTQYQDNWLFDRRRDITAASERMERDASAYRSRQRASLQVNHAQQADSIFGNASFAAQIQQGCGFNPATSGDLDHLAASDYMNAYALHVAGVFRWLNRDSDRKQLDNAAALAPASPAARDRAEAATGTRPTNQVWIWVEDGLCPVREEWRFDLPLVLMPFVGRYLPYVGMALPKLRERTWGATSWTVQPSGGSPVPMADVADVDKLVRTEYDVYMRGALKREITRCVVKAAVQVALGVTADNVSDRNTQIALKLAQMGVAVWAATSVAADLRSWTALPKSVKAIRIDRPADGRIDVIADAQRIQLTVPEGNTMLFLRKASPQAFPVVKQVTFR